MTADLVTWLHAQLDEDERVATAAYPNVWTADEGMAEGEYWIVPDHFASSAAVARGPKNAEHIARWDPDRVLAKVRADRRVIDTLRGYEPNDEWGTQPDMGQRANNAAGALRALAQPYAGRPGWREEWATA